MNQPEFYPIELLHWSGMQDKHLPVIEDILSAHPEYINTLNNEKDNALMIAIRLSNIRIMRYFLEHTSIDRNHVSKEGNFFMVALKYATKDLISILLSDYKHLIDFNVVGAEGNFFMVALKYAQKDTCKMLFNDHRDLIDFDSLNSQGKSFLHLAAFRGYDFIFEEESLVHHYIHQKDLHQQRCLFDMIDGYVSHKNFWCFDLLQEKLSSEEIRDKNSIQQDIFSYFYQVKLPQFSTVKNPDTQEVIISDIIRENIIKTYTPVFNILEQR